MLANVLITTFFFSIDLFFLALAGALRLFPSFLRSARIFLNQFMDLSFNFYRMVLGEIAPFLQHRWGFNILVGALRIVSTVILSIILGVLIIWVCGLSVTIFSLFICILHGLAVGMVWDEMDPVVEGFRMGENIE